MRLVEFYNPSHDQAQIVRSTNTRKHRLTLRELKKLRRIREIKQAENDEHDKFVAVMYAPPMQQG